MKSFSASSTLLAFAFFAIHASATPDAPAAPAPAPASTPAPAGQPGPCRDKYRGNLIVNLGGTDVSKFKQVGVHTSTNNRTLSTSETSGTQVVKVIFQECQIDGWNAGQEEYGHLIIATEGNGTSVTASNQALSDGSFSLSMQPTIASGSNGDSLARQWFYANYFAGSDGNPSIQLQLFGNPNQDGTSFRAPHSNIQKDGSISVDNNTTTPYFSKLRIVDPEIMHLQPMVQNKPTTNEQKLTQDLQSGKSLSLSGSAKSFFLSITSNIAAKKN